MTAPVFMLVKNISDEISVSVSPSTFFTGPITSSPYTTLQFSGTVVGGTAPFTYSWSSSDPVFSLNTPNLLSTTATVTISDTGIHSTILTLTVTDAFGNETSDSASISIYFSTESGVDPGVEGIWDGAL